MTVCWQWLYPFFRSAWNVFDALVVIISILGILISELPGVCVCVCVCVCVNIVGCVLICRLLAAYAVAKGRIAVAVARPNILTSLMPPLAAAPASSITPLLLLGP
jgi:hypothetical protein